MKNKILILILLGISSTRFTFSQDTILKPDTTIYMIAETMPKFLISKDKADFQGFRQFFMKQFRYPDTDIDYCCRINFQFIVEPDGSISSIQFLRYTPNDFQNEIKRVLNLITYAIPAKINKKPVRLKVPISMNIMIQ